MEKNKKGFFLKDLYRVIEIIESMEMHLDGTILLVENDYLTKEYIEEELKGNYLVLPYDDGLKARKEI